MTVCTAALVWQVQTWHSIHHKNAAGPNTGEIDSQAWHTLQVCCQPRDKGESYLHEDPPGSKCFQLHVKAVEVLGAVHLWPPAGMLGSIALHRQ